MTIKFSLSQILIIAVTFCIFACKDTEQSEAREQQDNNASHVNNLARLTQKLKQQVSTNQEQARLQDNNTIRVNDLTWMTKNLDISTSNSFCVDNAPEKCETLGRLYEWNAARNACPEGWRLPSFNDWKALESYLGAAKMQGFIGNFAGGTYKGKFAGEGTSAGFWTSESTENGKKGLISLSTKKPSMEFKYASHQNGFSVRCVSGTSRFIDTPKFLRDHRNGRTYKTVTIGTQTWMAENLNYKIDGSSCYDDKESNCNRYGRLYDYEATLYACPEGWHLPTLLEWQTLFKYAGGINQAAKKLKSKSGWGSKANGTNAYGFNVQPAGIRYDFSSAFQGEMTVFWSSNNGYLPIGWEFSDSKKIGKIEYSMENEQNWKTYIAQAYSIRCIQD